MSRVTEDGGFDWDRSFGSTGEEGASTSIVTTTDGGFLTSSYSTLPSGPGGIYLIKASTSPARFSAAPRSGAAPLAVQFTDETTGAPTAWAWDFDGDGVDDATTQNPQHVYGAPGLYTTRLIAQIGAVLDTLIRPSYVEVAEALTAGFSASPTSGDAPLSVTFTDESTGSPTAWAWDFDGDGVTDSAVQSPTFVYGAPGAYDVRLIVTRDAEADTLVKVAYIQVQGPLVAGFSATPTSGNAALQVAFTDESTGPPTAWAWDFDGNGVTDSAAQSPTFTYTTQGVYDVRLIVTRGAEADTLVRSAYIHVDPPLVAGFSATPTSGSAPLQVTFTDESSGSPTAWAWDFNGDGGTDSAVQSPTFVYGAEGAYDVRLIVSRGGRADTLVKTGYINVGPADYFVKPDGSGPFPTIQAAIDAAPAGAIVELDDGVFTGSGNRSVSFLGKGITLRSRSGNAEACIIDAEGSSGVEFVNNEDTTSVLADVTIRNSSRAIQCTGASPRISGCVISGSQGTCAGLNLVQSSARVDSCLFVANVALGQVGAAVCCSDAFPVFTRCTFYENRAYQGSCFYINPGSDPTLLNCTLYGNFGDAIRLDGRIDLQRTIIAYTQGHPNGAALVMNSGATITASCCDVVGNVDGWGTEFAAYLGVDGNFEADPQFCDSTRRDFSLHEGSPCLGENNPSCGLIGAWALGCVDASFSADPTIGLPPLDVQFTDLTGGPTTRWEWDFDNDGVVDATEQNPLHEYVTPGSYSVGLKVFDGQDIVASGVKSQYVRVLGSDDVILHPTEIVSGDPTGMPVEFYGRPLSAISIVLDYDATRLTYVGVQSLVPGETFSEGVVGGKIFIQWFGLNPIAPDADGDTLFTVLFTNMVQSGSARVTFDRAQCLLGDANSDEIQGVSWVDEAPFGTVNIDIGAVVSGVVAYYLTGSAVPGVVLSLDPPHLAVESDSMGHYLLPRQSYGDYVLHGSKSTDLGGINSLDAVKVIRHTIAAELFTDPNQLRAADVDLNGHINALDALKIVRTSVGLAGITSANWVFDPDSTVFSPLDRDVEQSFVAIRMGDVNGSWTPDPPATGNGATGGGGAIIALAREQERAGAVVSPDGSTGPSLALPDTVIATDTPTLALSLMASGIDSVEAISLRILFDPSVLHYQGVSSRVQGVSFVDNQVGNEIRIEWFDAIGTKPLSIGDDTLLVITFDPVGQAGQSTPLSFLGSSEVGDAQGNPVAGVSFIDGSCLLTEPLDASAAPTGPRGAQFYGALPNPSSSARTFLYRLSDPGSVELALFDLTGRRVVTLVDGHREAGLHTVGWDGRAQNGEDVRAGVYFARFRALGDVRTKRVVVLSR